MTRAALGISAEVDIARDNADPLRLRVDIRKPRGAKLRDQILRPIDQAVVIDPTEQDVRRLAFIGDHHRPLVCHAQGQFGILLEVVARDIVRA